MPGIDLQEIIFDVCCWCGKQMTSEEMRISFGMSLDGSSQEVIATLRGRSIEIESAGIAVIGTVYEEGSPAQNEGEEIGFAACSDECAQKTCDFLNSVDEIRLVPLRESTVILKTGGA